MNDNPLLPVLRDAAEALRDLGLRHALIGGVAAIVHGSTRATRDVDFSIEPPGDDAALASAMTRHGFSDVARRGAVVQAMHASGYRADLLIEQGPFEQAIIQGAMLWRLEGGLELPVARAADVVAFKLLAGRPRDLRDIEELAERNSAFDWERVAALLARLDVTLDPEECRQAEARDELRALLKRVAAALRG